MDPILSYFTYITVALLEILRAVVASEGEVGSGDQPREVTGKLSRVGNRLHVEGSRGRCQNSSSYTL